MNHSWGGPANLDLRFQSQFLRFIGDVRALSDRTYRKDNPTHALSGHKTRNLFERYHIVSQHRLNQTPISWTST